MHRWRLRRHQTWCGPLISNTSAPLTAVRSRSCRLLPPLDPQQIAVTHCRWLPAVSGRRVPPQDVQRRAGRLPSCITCGPKMVPKSVGADNSDYANRNPSYLLLRCPATVSIHHRRGCKQVPITCCCWLAVSCSSPQCAYRSNMPVLLTRRCHHSYLFDR
jgi:hypothetical protein